MTDPVKQKKGFTGQEGNVSRGLRLLLVVLDSYFVTSQVQPKGGIMKKIFFSLSVFFLLLSSPCLAGEWNLTGSVNQGREEAPSEIFDNGDVLIAGGIANCIVLSSCEIYDIVTGIWEETDSMTFARRDFPLAKFRDNDFNKFLVGGGTSSLIAEIFNPQSMTWEQTGPMHYLRLEAPAIAFPDPNNDENDLVLFVGGDWENNYRSCEIFNPATGTFTMTGFLVEGKSGAKLIYNKDLNVIMAIGGWGDNGMTSFYDCEIYDIATGIWTQIAPTNYPHEHHTANYDEENATILVVGSSYSPHNSCELYDFATDIWAITDTLEIGRWNHCSKTLLNNKILAIGGQRETGIGSCEIYNPTIDQWQTAASTYHEYGNFSSEVLKDERILAIRSWCEIYTWNYQPTVSQPQTLGGLNEAIVGEILTFFVTATDPDGDSIAVRINWGDNETSEWTELQASGTTFELSHSWTEAGQYEVRAQSADQWYFQNPETHNSLSNWSQPLIVTIVGNAIDPTLGPTPTISIYPNPFSTSTTISFSCQVRHDNISAKIYNIKGQEIRILECINRVNAKTTRSFYSITWNGKDYNNKPVVNGIYFCSLKIGENEIFSRKIVLIK